MDFTLLPDLDMNDPDLNEFENDGGVNGFSDLLFSNSVAENKNIDLTFIFDQETEINRNIYSTNGSEDSAMPSDKTIPISDAEANSALIVDGHDFINIDLPYDLYEETLRTDKDVDMNKNLFESINDDMYVIEQPKADRRSRYESDGIRFLPDSRKNPMSIHLPNLAKKPLNENQKYGIILTMVTSSKNPNKKTYVHVNEIKYHTDDTIPIGNGSIFIPISDFDIKNAKKTFPRLSIICKKYDHYSFELHAFDFLASNRPIETYTPTVEILPTKSAKGKQFTIDYDLLSYKFIFQLAVKQDNQYFISSIKCETDIINEQKNLLISKKRTKKQKNNRTLRKSKSNKLPVIRRSTRMTKKPIKNIT